MRGFPMNLSPGGLDDGPGFPYFATADGKFEFGYGGPPFHPHDAPFFPGHPAGPMPFNAPGMKTRRPAKNRCDFTVKFREFFEFLSRRTHGSWRPHSHGERVWRHDARLELPVPAEWPAIGESRPSSDGQRWRWWWSWRRWPSVRVAGIHELRQLLRTAEHAKRGTRVVKKVNSCFIRFLSNLLYLFPSQRPPTFSRFGVSWFSIQFF
jgi:hypothetical protein